MNIAITGLDFELDALEAKPGLEKEFEAELLQRFSVLDGTGRLIWQGMDRKVSRYRAEFQLIPTIEVIELRNWLIERGFVGFYIEAKT